MLSRPLKRPRTHLDQVPHARLEEQLLVRELLRRHGLGPRREARDEVHGQGREADAAEYLCVGRGVG